MEIHWRLLSSGKKEYNLILRTLFIPIDDTLSYLIFVTIVLVVIISIWFGYRNQDLGLLCEPKLEVNKL
jgi:hypothetical protein